MPSKRDLTPALIGGFSFWVPDIVTKGLGIDAFHSVRILSVLSPVTLFLSYMICRSYVDTKRRRIVLAMLAGAWILSPVMISVATTFAGGFWARPSDQWIATFLLVAAGTVFPPLWISFSTYDGTLGALLVATVAMTGEYFQQCRYR
jgi:uncharacterized membrane protein AbrB (regulator of aidB expression)